MIIDCDSCAVRGTDCADCVVTFLTVPVRPRVVAGTARGPDAAAGAVELDAGEQHAIGVLAASGLVPPLRLVAG
ncbi:hypothetical protein [Cellulomonas fimi]|uniref:Uncharacterized protein n=1 Tax=Cellulomonas fimi (strain ATCC 484 / DSM 20113 / JCM 1341 / CCUG 24087 / LMG 16345 / NBRC 15513 / NCIMB 8980 / NCTC 7547 / NRS-133) TaxID=590998 RepID=F4H1K5_CELFA|nr:hypothetical protein [Cellulomonas fimi]AEE46304.1 hypothetical protein Celf_2176 [Cellulomonas fimi ATCC 484]VEH32452.1 Uncharacterised protein [Cellulomonas fimi]